MSNDLKNKYIYDLKTTKIFHGFPPFIHYRLSFEVFLNDHPIHFTGGTDIHMPKVMYPP